jgi:hypothetical protein
MGADRYATGTQFSETRSPDLASGGRLEVEQADDDRPEKERGHEHHSIHGGPAHLDSNQGLRDYEACHIARSKPQLTQPWG